MLRQTIKELREHIPFTATATLLGVVFVAVVFFLGPETLKVVSYSFHYLHPAHVFVSAVVTAAIFYKYKKNFLYALGIGIVGSIAIGSLSDIILPWLGGTLLGMETSFHLPIIEEPLLIIGVALLASIFGIVTLRTKLPHLIHVLLSVFASLFYLIAYSPAFNLLYLIGSFVIVFVAVIVPCCVSDIVFPLLFVRGRGSH